MEQWEKFLAPYKQAVEELKVKLKGMRQDYQLNRQSSPVEFVTARVKPVQSIIERPVHATFPTIVCRRGCMILQASGSCASLSMISK